MKAIRQVCHAGIGLVLLFAMARPGNAGQAREPGGFASAAQEGRSVWRRVGSAPGPADPDVLVGARARLRRHDRRDTPEGVLILSCTLISGPDGPIVAPKPVPPAPLVRP